MDQKSPTHWLRRAKIYHILIDRFAGFTPAQAANWDLPVFIGGDIQGITTKLDYLLNLGINALMLSPICKTTDYHGYHITDFLSVEPRFGSLHDLQTLINKCHQKNLKVIADFVPNHCHDTHPFFQEAIRDPQSLYRDWFIFDKKNHYQTFLGYQHLPKINLQNSHARTYMIDTALYWQAQGFDAFRIDHVIGVSHDFLKQLSQTLKQTNPQTALIGEAVIDLPNLKKYFKTLFMNDLTTRRKTGFSQDSLQKDYCGVIDGVLDFTFQHLLSQFVKNQLTPKSLQAAIKKHFTDCPKDFTLVIFLDNHDMNRLFCECRRTHHDYNQATEVLKQAIQIATHSAKEFNHPITIYYGDEILLNQVAPMTGHYPYEDLLARGAMNWSPTETQLAFRTFFAEQLKKLSPLKFQS
jgi:glycosidase